MKHKRYAAVMSFRKLELKRVPFGLAQAPTYFKQLINEVLRGPPFALDVLNIFSNLFKRIKTSQTSQNCVLYIVNS